MNVNVVLLLLSLNYPLGDIDDHNARSTDMFPESYYPHVIPLLVALVLHSSSYAFHCSMLQQLASFTGPVGTSALVISMLPGVGVLDCNLSCKTQACIANGSSLSNAGRPVGT